MKLLLQLSKKLLILTLLNYLILPVSAETKDIWKQSKDLKVVNPVKDKSNNQEKIINKDLPSTVFDKSNLNLSINQITQSAEINDQEVIFGVYEPDKTKIDLNFWIGIDKNIYEKLVKTLLQNKRKSLVELSEKILFTKSNINAFDDKGSQHLKFISSWLVSNKQLELIDQVIKQNEIINQNANLLNFLFIHYLSLGQIEKACSYPNLMKANVESLELEKYKIFCLVNSKKVKQAQSQIELVRETSALDSFFLDKINFIAKISEKKGVPNFDNVFNAHLSIIIHDELDLKYENFSNSKELRNYFFKSGLASKLLENAMINSSAEKKNNLNDLVIFLERSVNEDLFDYERILEIYKKYNFSFNQLFEVERAVKDLKRPESHAILYQAMLLAQKPEIKLQILNNFKDKLILNGLDKIANPVYYNELEKIYNANNNLIKKELKEKIIVFKRSQEKEKISYNNDFLYSSELKKLFDSSLDKKNKNRILKILNDFDRRIKDNQYKLRNKDIAFINLLKNEKIDLPKSMTPSIYDKQIYIPNEIFNALEKKSVNEAILKTLLFISSLDESAKDYPRDILAIMKVFDSVKLDYLKLRFIESEFSL